MKRFCLTALSVAWAFCALAAGKSGNVVYINGAKYYIHTVQAGETLYALSKTYNVGEKVIRENNPSIASGLRAGEHVKIPFIGEVAEQQSEKKLRKTFDLHSVVKGETLYGIARLYEIPVRSIIDDNPDLDPAHLKLGERILIRKKQIGSQNDAANKAQWEAYRASLNSVAESGVAYHIVQPGETVYSLARQFGTTETALGALNGGLKAADLKAGAIIKVPGAPTAAPAGEQIAQSEPADTIRQSETADPFADRKVDNIEFRALRPEATLRVALLLPLAKNGETNANFMEFYQGFLLGLDSVKNGFGHSVAVDLYNTDRDPEKLRETVESDAFQAADLIVGPVYEDELYPVVQVAEKRRTPVVSPLAHIARMNSDVLFQMAPDPDRKWEKVADLVNGDKRVTLIYTANTDHDFEQEMLALLGDSEYRKHTYKYTHPTAVREAAANPGDLTPLLENSDDNVFIILADNEIDVERILAALASADTNLTARGRTAPRYVVLGNARWNRYNNIDRTIFFKDRVIFISTYHAKRDSQAVTDFDSAYIRAYGSLPSLYSYRGYDAAMIFVPAMYNDIEYDMEGRRYAPLQTTYLFGPTEGRHNHVNRNWMRVNYNPDFTITIQ